MTHSLSSERDTATEVRGKELNPIFFLAQAVTRSSPLPPPSQCSLMLSVNSDMKEMDMYTMSDVSGFFFPFLSTVTAIIIEKIYHLIRIMTKRLIMMVDGGIAIQALGHSL